MSETLQAEMQAIREGAAFAPITDRAFLRITGSDATRWLNGMVTNSIQALQPGEGCYNFLLNAQGRIQGDCTIYREPGEGDVTFLLETGSLQLETVQQLLDKFIIMDDVEMNRLEGYEEGVVVLGPGAVAAIESFTPVPASQLRMDGWEMKAFTNGRVLSLRPYESITPIVEVFGRETGNVVAHHTAIEEGATPVSLQALEAFRILSGTPKYGIDIRDRDLPQETNQPQALHFAKGCYLGQEIVERIRSRGQVHRLFTAFRLEGDLPTTLPMPLEANGKPAGELTSAAVVPTAEGDQLLALGYARREALDTNQTLTYAGGIAVPRTP